MKFQMWIFMIKDFKRKQVSLFFILAYQSRSLVIFMPAISLGQALPQPELIFTDMKVGANSLKKKRERE